MAKLNKIYTGMGDEGWTKLMDGLCRSKNDLRIDACGTLDETNAAIGIARLHTVNDHKLDPMLMRIQSELFDLGADLAVPEGNIEMSETGLYMDVQVERLEEEIDEMNMQLDPLTSFVFPEGTSATVFLHFARTVTRRAERVVTALHRSEKINPSTLRYINRLSDFLFVAARFSNRNGHGDKLWTPSATR